MRTMENADKKRNRLLLVKHTHIHNRRPLRKTHCLMLEIEEACRQGEKQVTSGLTYTIIQDNYVKLTD